MSKRWGALKGEHVEARTLAGSLRDLVGATGMSLVKLAGKIPYSKSTISAHLSGENRPPWEFVYKLVQTCAPNDERTRDSLITKFRESWEQADPARATLFPLHDPLQENPDDPNAHGVFTGQFKDIVDALDDIANRRALASQAQWEMSRGHDLVAGIQECQQRLEATIQDLISECGELRRERDRSAAGQNSSSSSDERLSSVSSQLAEAQQRLETADALQAETERRLRDARQQVRLAEELRDQAMERLRQTLAVAAELPTDPETKILVLQRTVDPRSNRAGPSSSSLMIRTDDQRFAVDLLRRMDEELAARRSDLAALERAIKNNAGDLASYRERRQPDRPAGGLKNTRIGLQLLVILLASIIGAGAALIVVRMINHREASSPPEAGAVKSTQPSKRGAVKSPLPSQTGAAKSTPSPKRAAAKSPSPPQSGAYEVSGKLTCSSGNRVVGAWLQGESSSGMVTLKVVGKVAEYSYKQPRRENYSLHVGCGGTAANWAVDPHTVLVGGARNSFECFDVQGAPHYKFCQARPE